MKLLKPSYNAERKEYLSKVESGVRLTSELEGGCFCPTLEELQSTVLGELIPKTVESTKGWFTKPLTQEWLQTRCEVHLPNPDEGFEGKLTWELQEILITKDKFKYVFSITEKVAVEKIQINLDEAELEEADEEPPVSLDPTRRIHAKQKVLRARARAARALFKAERLTQEYMMTFGEDTDWEDEESGMESS